MLFFLLGLILIGLTIITKKYIFNSGENDLNLNILEWFASSLVGPSIGFALASITYLITILAIQFTLIIFYIILGIILGIILYLSFFNIKNIFEFVGNFINKRTKRQEGIKNQNMKQIKSSLEKSFSTLTTEPIKRSVYEVFEDYK